MENLEKILSRYDFDYPRSSVAAVPAEPRDCAKLLVYDRASEDIFCDTFSNLCKYLPKGAVLVFNETKVLPARLVVFKETGGKAQVLYLGFKNGLWKVMSDRKLTVGSRVSVSQKIWFKVSRQNEKFYFLKPNFPKSQIEDVLLKYGKTPIPPYIKNTPLSEKKLREKYQTVFARKFGSVAAPTASLHFTKRLLRELRKRGVQTIFIILHVNLGTFAPLTENEIKSNKLHSEFYEIPAKVIEILNKAKKDGRPIVAVGTTVVRALESAVGNDGRIERAHGETTLFIRENSKIKFVSQVITNFHVPRSSLMMLISAFVGRKKLLDLYRVAIKKDFRLFSFGDGMYVR